MPRATHRRAGATLTAAAVGGRSGRKQAGKDALFRGVCSHTLPRRTMTGNTAPTRTRPMLPVFCLRSFAGGSYLWTLPVAAAFQRHCDLLAFCAVSHSWLSCDTMTRKGDHEPQIAAFLFRVTDCDSRSQAMTFINVFNGFTYLDGLQTDDGR